MTRQILFVQGGGQKVHDEWDNRLVDSLEHELGQGYTVRYPRMPHEAEPRYADWAAALDREFATLDDGALLVGHSIGGTILIRRLADHPPTLAIDDVFLIAAPFVGAGGWQSEDVAPLSDLGAELPEGMAVHLYHGTKDETAPVTHVDLYAKAIPRADVHRLAGRDHQLDNDLSEVAADIRRLRHRRGRARTMA